MMRSPAVRLYARLLWLLPAHVRQADGAEMLATLAAQLRDTERLSERVGVLARAFGRLPAVLVAEWIDRMLDGAPGPARRARTGAMERLMQVFSHGARSLGRSPGFVCSTVLLLGLGVGGVTTIFTLVDHVVLRALPYPSAERLVEVQNGSHSGPLWRAMHEFQTVETWAGTRTETVNLTGVGRPEELRAARVTRDFFAVFGARPGAGRLLTGEDFQLEQGVVLSAGLWERTFGADPGLIGRTIVIDGQPEVVLGVMDPSFTPPEALVGNRVDLWRPMNWTEPKFQSHGFQVLKVAGRLAPGAAPAAAQAEMDALLARLAAELPDRYVDSDGKLREKPVVGLKEGTAGEEVRQGLSLLFGAVTLLLLVACANVAHLFMARGLARTHEMAMRRALGARTRVLAGQLLVESLLVGLVGAALGLLLAKVGLGAFMALAPDALPRADAVRIDMRVLGFAAAVGGVTAIVFGMFPALRLVGRNAEGMLQGRGRGNSDNRRDARLRATLIVAEVALSVILVIQAGSFLRAFAQVHSQELGFRTEDIWTLPLSPRNLDGPADWSRRMDAVREALSAVPGVRMATYGVTMPLEWTGGSRCCWSSTPSFLDTSDPEVGTRMHVIDTDYFALLELEFVSGRPWMRGEDRSYPAPAVVTEPLAIQVYGSAADAVGQEFTSERGDPDADRYRIVGVVADNRHYGPDQEHGPAAYLPAAATAVNTGRAHMAARIDLPSANMFSQLRNAVWSVEPDLPVPTIRSLDDWTGEATAQARFTAALFTVFGVVALLLMAGGLYGTLLYAVGRERRELGIRLALGDLPSRLERRVLTRGVATAAVGCVLGAAGVWGTGQILASQLEGLETGQPSTLLGATAILLLVAVAASWLPARRAARTDPVEALKAD